jgi:hypothetical protein
MYHGATTLSITTLSIMGLVTTVSINDSIDIRHNSIECHYAEWREYLNVMLSVVRLKVFKLNVVMLNVVAPYYCWPMLDKI